jgi:hypothetical protein
MPAIRLVLIAGMLATLPACLATKIVTVPVGIAGDVVEGTAKGAYAVGSGVVHATGDALDDVKLKVKVKKFGGGTKTYTRTVESDDIEKTLEKIGKKGTIIDVQVEAAE